MHVSRNPSPHRYLSLVGAFPAWGRLVLGLLIITGLAEWYFVGRTESSRLLFLVIAPVTAGTGLLASARQGRLDLLLGKGTSRRRIFGTAALLAVGIPVVAAAFLTALDSAGGGAAHATSLAVRGGATAAFTMGLAFAVGLLEPRYAVGVSWTLVRFGFFLSPFGLRSSALLRLPEEADGGLALWRKVLAVAAVPELMVDGHVPIWFPLAAAVVGAIALAVSLHVFGRTDFSGRRAE
jgi:hypothetical protein